MGTKKVLVNNVSAEQAVLNSKANSFLAKDLLSSMKEKTQGLLNTSLGTKTEIYKNSLFEGMNEKQVKATRKKFRNFTYNALSTIVDKKDNKLISVFIDFYKEAYALNDFSFSSIASENTKEEKKEILKKGLQIVSESLKK